MSRSNWKGYYLSKTILKLKSFLKNDQIIKIWNRNSIIPEFLTGKKVSIHCGKDFKELLITSDHIGYKFGEFAFTRFHGGHKNLKKLQKKSKKK